MNSLRGLKQRLLRATFKKRTAVHRYLGTERVVHLFDPIGEEWYDRDYAAVPEIEFLRTKGLGRGQLIFDLGAHQSVIAMMLSELVGEEGQVVAVEGSRHNIEVSQKNIEANSLSNIVLVNAVVARCVGTMPFVDAGNGFISRRRRGTANIEAVTIDSLTGRFGVPDVVFVDIEGFELEALGGAEATLRSNVTWLVEVHGDEVIARYGGDNKSVVSKFLDCGYELDFADVEEGVFRALHDVADTPRGRFFLAASRNTGLASSS